VISDWWKARLRDRGPGALPRFRLRKAYGATGSEADVEQRGLVMQQPWFVLALLPEFSPELQRCRASIGEARVKRYRPVYYGLASEAALHGAGRKFPASPALSLQFNQENVVRQSDRFLDGWAIAFLERNFVRHRMAE
jgi:hypothetical protein